MSYDAKETGLITGNPAELYEFVKGSDRYLFTSADRAISVSLPTPVTFEKSAMNRGEPEQGSDLERAAISITVPIDHEIARLFIAFVPGDTIVLTIYRMHRDDGEIVTFWKGIVRNVAWLGGEARIECDPLRTLLDTPGLRFQFQPTCNHMLYSSACGALIGSFSHSGVITAIDGDVITSSAVGAQAAGYFDGGIVQRAGGDRRMIVSTSGNDATLLFQFATLGLGETVTFIAGCDRSATVCDTRFNRLSSHGGFPDMPIKNPFDVGIEG